MLTKMVTKHRSGEMAPGGIYFSRKTWDLTNLPEEGGRLPEGDEPHYYYRLPLILVMVLGPMAGLAFVLFLPLAVPIMVLYATPKAIAAAIRRRRETKSGLNPDGPYGSGAPGPLHRLGGGH